MSACDAGPAMTEMRRLTARRRKVQQRRLRPLEIRHDAHRNRQTQQVAEHSSPEIWPAEAAPRPDVLSGMPSGILSQIETKAKSNHETRNDDVAQSQHGEVCDGTGRRTRGEEFYRCVEPFGYCDHHGSGKDLKDQLKAQGRFGEAVS